MRYNLLMWGTIAGLYAPDKSQIVPNSDKPGHRQPDWQKKVGARHCRGYKGKSGGETRQERSPDSTGEPRP